VESSIRVPGGVRVQGDLARIHAGEEILAQERHQQHGTATAPEGEHEGAALGHGQRQQVAITLAQVGKDLLEALLQPGEQIFTQRGMLFGMELQQIERQGRHQGARQDEGGDHGEHHRQGHGHKQKARHALQREHRHKGDTDAEARQSGG
jgi:hypothetical protein